MIVVIDNYDSFAYNLVQYVGSSGRDVRTFRNDQITVAEVLELSPNGLIVSPGPCRPEQAGISMELIRSMDGSIPLLGVCLGHQAIGAVFGADIVHAPELLHGKVSPVAHDATGVHRQMPSPFIATRYHSLTIDGSTLPDVLRVNAWTPSGDIMGIIWPERRLHGVQYHPESWMTEQGMTIVNTFLDEA